MQHTKITLFDPTEYQNTIKEYHKLKYKTTHTTKHTTHLTKPQYGSKRDHLIIAVLTAWWTLGLGNILLLMYNYVFNSKRVILNLSKFYVNKRL